MTQEQGLDKQKVRDFSTALLSLATAAITTMILADRL
jgi:hypothetical protein